ncbi:phage replisome organizer protein [Lactococcus garvieae]|uniref:phage replisome organizer protein n=2 Tax=Lactococcus garvieae TaxID=1363 RepID=UPI000266BDE9|nr:phage replisome organiser protein [Lactococcus garvieae]EIT66288.1 Phage protein, replication protein [Lactococcus garvieae IPLA 31405]MBS4464803.1 phage replisome organizer protein [Lactococcus garvieae]UHU65801.1 prephenate dehydrogenase [Lactococcus garvieae]
MADNKKYYYMRLKENFFDSDEMIILENMDNGDGIIYSNILLKLYLRSLKYEGRLMFNDRIPFNPQMLSTIVRHPVGVVEKALKAFIDLGLVEIMDNGAIYMLDIQNFIGKTTTEADRQREYQARIAKEKKAVRNLTGNLGEISEKITPETEIELEKELKIDIDIDIENREKEPSSLLAEFLNLFINFSSKNLSKKAITQVEFLKLPSFQQEQAVIGAKNYIEWYKNEKPEDTKGQYSVNSANFLSNMMFMDYQEAPKTVQGTLGGMI